MFGEIFEPSVSFLSLGIIIDPAVGVVSVVYKCVGEVEAILSEEVGVANVWVHSVESFALGRKESDFFLPLSNLERSALSESGTVIVALAGDGVGVVDIITGAKVNLSSETVFVGTVLSPDPVSKIAAPVVSTAESTLTSVESRSPNDKFLSSSPKRYWPTTDPLDTTDGTSSSPESPVPSPLSQLSLPPRFSWLSTAARPCNSAVDRISRSLLKCLSGDLTSTPLLPPFEPPRT